MQSAYFVTKWHSFGTDDTGDEAFFFVNYGPIDVTASSWIVPGSIIDIFDTDDL